MELIVLDWTRMGKTHCLAGVVLDDLDVRVVRPLPARFRASPIRNVGWSPFLYDGHQRWEMFELVDPQPAEPEPPHLEDVWVRDLRPLRQTAPPELRRRILAATASFPRGPLFGAALTSTRTGAYLAPGTGERSLVTVRVPSGRIDFAASWREWQADPDVRVKLPLADLGERVLAVKDHHLLRKAEEAGDLERRVERLRQIVRGMGEQVAVRLGLSRAFQNESGPAPTGCWLMADGFFSLSDPQP
ncbi:MAG: hypothetical protein L0Z62_22980 [Gemmataceae bacterium]|nr:hypothetical protein [Gemmataceae bacterium]